MRSVLKFVLICNFLLNRSKHSSNVHTGRRGLRCDPRYAAKQREQRKETRLKGLLEAKIAYTSFRKLLKGMFGSYIRAWRAIDTDGSFSLTMAEVLLVISASSTYCIS